MDAVIKRSNFLVFRGVFPQDFLKSRTNTAEITTAKKEPTIEYSEIPKKFISVESWPKSTNLLCWSCSRSFTNPPAFIPTNPKIDNENRDVCDVIGNFCRWSCASRYVKEVLPEPMRYDHNKYICLFESKFTDVRREIVKPSPPKTEMQAYCGKNGLTPKQWIAKADSIDRDYSISGWRIDMINDK
jgi:hypothetical protein